MASCRKIYLLYCCNEWKSHESMRLLCVCTNLTRFIATVKREVKKGHMDYKCSGDDRPSHRKQAASFSKDWELRDEDFWFLVNGDLKYGYIDVVENGEALC